MKSNTTGFLPSRGLSASRLLATSAVVLGMGVCVNASAATYYVDTNNASASDSNPGTKALPWKTIGKASSTMVAGDTAVVLAGTYSGSVSTTRAGTSSARISFVAAGIVNTSGWTIAHSYVTVNGFHLNGSEISIKNASNCEVLNSEIVNGAISWGTLATSDSCVVKGNYLHGAVSPGGDFPQITVFGTNHVIEANEIGPASDIDAFRIFGSNHVVRNNYVHDITYSPNSAAHMDMFQTFGDNGWVSNNITIENNRFINSKGQLFNTSQDGVSGIHDYIVRNNVFANISQNANVGLPNFYFYNNTLYNTGIIYQVTGGAGQPFNGSNLVVKNNIFVGVAGCSNTDFDNVYNNPSNLPLTRSNNFYSDCSGRALSNYRAETGSVNGGAINFVNAAQNNFALNSPSPAIGKGTQLSGFAYDILNQSRTTWDMGAFAFTGGTATSTFAPTHLQAQ